MAHGKSYKATLTRKVPAVVAGMFGTMVTEEVEVRVMAEAEGWAMVRRNRAMPFICQAKDLKPIPQKGCSV